MDETKEQVLDDLIDRLRQSDRYINLDLMATIMAQGDTIVDRLIEIVESEDNWASVHAMLMLIEMRAETALPAIGQALLKDPDLNEWVDTEGLDKYGPVAIDTLEMIVQEEAADWYPRGLAASALVRIAARYPETYERITAILRDLLPPPDIDFDKAHERGDPGIDLWHSIVADLSQLRDPEAYATIGQLFDANLVDTLVINRKRYEELYRSTDPFYGEKLEPGDLLSEYRGMQEAWRRSEARRAAATQQVPMAEAQPLQAVKPQPVQPSRRDERRARKQARKSQRKARRAQRKKHKKKKKR